MRLVFPRSKWHACTFPAKMLRKSCRELWIFAVFIAPDKGKINGENSKKVHESPWRLSWMLLSRSSFFVRWAVGTKLPLGLLLILTQKPLSMRIKPERIGFEKVKLLQTWHTSLQLMVRFFCPSCISPDGLPNVFTWVPLESVRLTEIRVNGTAMFTTCYKKGYKAQ